jgi:hypothetical protein
MHIMEVDELIAAWCFQRRNKHTRSYDFSQVPTEYRYGAPPNGNSPLMPCHVSLYSVTSNDISAAHSSRNFMSTAACHEGAFAQRRSVLSISELEAVDFVKRNVAPYISPIVDTITLARVIKDLGITCKAVAKEIRGRQYIVFSGYAGLRTLFRGTKYSRNNARIIQMAIGSLGIKNMIKGGARLTIYLTVPLTILYCILNDDTTMAEVLGNLTTDLLKIGISSIVGGAAALMAGAAVAYVAVPIIVAIVVCTGTGYLLDEIDSRYGVTKTLIEFIKAYQENAADAMASGVNIAGRGFYYGVDSLLNYLVGFRLSSALNNATCMAP